MSRTARTRPPRPPLSRQWIVSATLGLVGELGVQAVSMRRVAAAVDTAPAALYVHVADRDELMALAHDLAVAGVELPDERDGDWRARLELLVRRVVNALAAHRDIAVVGRDAAPGPNSLRITEELLRLLRVGGVPDRVCAWALDLLGQHIASAALEASAARGQRTPHDAYAALDAGEYPNLAALSGLLGSGDAESRARWKLRATIDGILAQAGEAGAAG
ncbi:TetR/AcrR family transcriptional regulator C-terminal domain-containing protein [Saccharothrix syringae]|uniref:TetR/AcrR family transcriptional regulator C-terminal domain-containing protein n=1 Tax=Saccharothrix syringae TaxID=103733 RepID=UPI0005269086|nr:TetR/AcrR family transcriptional regulator C-terminal domain-containing protein [Saccharothrix syringae]